MTCQSPRALRCRCQTQSEMPHCCKMCSGLAWYPRTESDWRFCSLATVLKKSAHVAGGSTGGPACTPTQSLLLEAGDPKQMPSS